MKNIVVIFSNSRRLLNFLSLGFLKVIFITLLSQNSIYAEDVGANPSSVPTELDLIAKSVIESQIKAFQRADIDAAYAFASPDIKSKFENAEVFGTMVKSAYPVIWKPEEFQFMKSMMVLDVIVQRVLFFDDNKKMYVFDYLIKKFDERWLINGVYLVENYSSGA